MALVRLLLTRSKIRFLARRPKSFPLRAYVSSVDHSGQSAAIRESNHSSGVCKEHYA